MWWVGVGALLQSFLTLDTRTDVICFSAAQHKLWGEVTNFFPSCTRVIKMVALCSEYICALQSGCDYICPPLLLSFLLWGDSRVKSWTAAKRGRPAAQLKLLQAKQEETQGAIREGKEKKKKTVRDHFQLHFFILTVSFSSCPLLKPDCICLPLLAGGSCGVGQPYCLEDREGVWKGRGGGIGFREFSWGEK